MQIKTIQELGKFVDILAHQLSTAERYFELSQEIYSQTLTKRKGTPFDAFFEQVYKSLQESTLSHLTRFYYYGGDSISLVYLLKQIDTNKSLGAFMHPSANLDRQQLLKDIAAISKGNKKCRGQIAKMFKMRDKYFSHYDLKHAAGIKNLPVINFAYLHHVFNRGKKLLFKYSDIFPLKPHFNVAQTYGFHKQFNFEKGQVKKILKYYMATGKIEGIIKKTKLGG